MEIKSILVLVILSFFTLKVQAKYFESISIKNKNIEIQIDSKLELFHIMLYLAGSDNLNKLDCEYKIKINEYFEKYKNDNSIQFVKRVKDNYHANLVLNNVFINKDYKFTNTIEFLTVTSFGLENNKENKIKILDSLILVVDLFGKKTDFKSFINGQKVYYIRKLEQVSKIVESMNLVNNFETFWGEKKDMYKMVVTLLAEDIQSASFTENGQLLSVFYLAPRFVVNNDINWGNSDSSNYQKGKITAFDFIYYGAGHEFGHTFVDPMLDIYSQKIDSMNLVIKTYDPSNITFLSESIQRSATSYFLIKNGREELAKSVLEDEINRGYIYNEIIIKLLFEYEKNREKYKSFRDFLPILLGELNINT